MYPARQAKNRAWGINQTDNESAQSDLEIGVRWANSMRTLTTPSDEDSTPMDANIRAMTRASRGVDGGWCALKLESWLAVPCEAMVCLQGPAQVKLDAATYRVPQGLARTLSYVCRTLALTYCTLHRAPSYNLGHPLVARFASRAPLVRHG